MKRSILKTAFALLLTICCSSILFAAENLLPDPSVELVKQKDQFGVPFQRWSGWIFEGACTFWNGQIARTGKTSAEIIGAQGGKVRLYTPAVNISPGKYRFTCYIRGLDITGGQWGACEDISFADDQYFAFKKSGSFGWTRVELVRNVTKQQDVQARIGLWGPGRLWVDDASVERVTEDTPISDAPIIGKEESPIAPPSAIDPARALRCAECGYRNMLEWGKCYACGATLIAGQNTQAIGPNVRTLASFEDGTVKPFTTADNIKAVQEHATEGKYSVRLDRGYLLWETPQDWSGYDFFKADVFNSSNQPVTFYFEVKDAATTDYWTRVNYNTVLPPGASTLIINTDLYVGEKSRPGRQLDRAHIVRVAMSIDPAKSPVYFDNLRLERDLSDKIKVPGLMAYSFGPGTSKPMSGFTAVTPSTIYSAGRGFGLKNAQVWRAYDMLQPEPLYEQGICIEQGGFAVDLPDGKYHVFVNLDSPSGFWGEYQVYRERVVKANGAEVVHDRMDLAAFQKKYFRFSEVEDTTRENTFDKYQKPYFQEKQFDVNVKGGQLYLEFIGENWANFVSALVIYPSTQAEAGQKYLDNLQERRRFYFDNYFKRVLPDGRRDAKGVIPELVPTADEQAQGLVIWSRNWMQDVPANAVPRRTEITKTISITAAARQLEPIVFCVTPFKELGQATITIGELVGPGGIKIPSTCIKTGVVSHRITRVTAEGSVYTIAPRLIMPRNSAILRKGVTTTFWLTLNTPKKIISGVYRGTIRLTIPGGKTQTVALNARLFATPLDELDVAAGPWGSSISLPWYGEETASYNWSMFLKSLAKMREYGLTAFSGVPSLRLSGWKDGKPLIDFTQADKEMDAARKAGFKMVINYNGGIQGFDNYFIDENAMKAAGFSKYVDFLRPILAAVQDHAKSSNWLPAAFNLCDEPLGDAAPRSAENARAWREAAPAGFLTTGATSVTGADPGNPHLQLAKALIIPDLNDHDDASIKAIHDAGDDWAFYNGGNRWTFGTYMYKCVKEYKMKFRLSWHWNASAGDPYYALDCREDDYAWCVANAKGELVPTIHFERDIRSGVDDYRAMLTLARLIKQKPNSPTAQAGKKLLEDKLASFKLGERNHDAKWPPEEFSAYRLKLLQAIANLSK